MSIVSFSRGAGKVQEARKAPGFANGTAVDMQSTALSQISEIVAQDKRPAAKLGRKVSQA